MFLMVIHFYQIEIHVWHISPEFKQTYLVSFVTLIGIFTVKVNTVLKSSLQYNGSTIWNQ